MRVNPKSDFSQYTIHSIYKFYDGNANHIQIVHNLRPTLMLRIYSFSKSTLNQGCNENAVRTEPISLTTI